MRSLVPLRSATCLERNVSTLRPPVVVEFPVVVVEFPVVVVVEFPVVVVEFPVVVVVVDAAAVVVEETEVLPPAVKVPPTIREPNSQKTFVESTAPLKPFPVMVTVVPPYSEPNVGEMLVGTGV